MIPKIIHYCWFGNNPLPDKVKKCMESWKKFCPDYKIMRWDESNYDYNKNQYISDAYKNKKWAFVADYARLDVVYQYGGIYLDTDVELIGNIDNLLSNHVFMAIEKYSKLVNTGLGFGAEPEAEELLDMKSVYDNLFFIKKDGSFNVIPCTKYTTDYLLQKGFVCEDKTQTLDRIKVYASDVFCPIDFETGKKTLTSNTLGIHWYDATWFSDHDKAIHNTEQKIKRMFPQPLSKVVCLIYRKGYRFIQYIKDGTMLENIKKKLHIKQ